MQSANENVQTLLNEISNLVESENNAIRSSIYQINSILRNAVELSREAVIQANDKRIEIQNNAQNEIACSESLKSIATELNAVLNKTTRILQVEDIIVQISDIVCKRTIKVDESLKILSEYGFKHDLNDASRLSKAVQDINLLKHNSIHHPKQHNLDAGEIDLF